LKDADHVREEVGWVATKDPIFPFWSSVNGENWIIRVNDFPDEHLYTLMINGQEDQSFDHWPEQWYVRKLAQRPNLPVGERKKTG
jgi:hypothetical protein